MSRFNNPKLLAMATPGLGTCSATVELGTRTAILERPLQAAAPSLPPARTQLSEADARPNSMQRFCFVVLCAYLLSASANDITLHLFHIKAYISTVAVLLMPLAFLATGAATRGFKTPLGGWWAGFAIWLVICAPFSVWRGDTLNVLSNYFLREYILFFVICACVVNLHQLKTLMKVLAFRAFVVLLTCIAFGSDQSGRFAVAGSPFFSNPNELALQLLLGMIFLMLSFYGESSKLKLISGVGMLISAGYMLKTGSRGILIAAIAVGILIFLLSRKKLAFAAAAIPAFLVTLALTPAHTRNRLTLIFAAPAAVTVHNDEELAAVGSQLQREQLLRESISYAFHHPLLGVGPGEFMAAEAGNQEKAGELAQWRGTHNSYTQVASEAGLPGFIFYIAAILICLRINLRLHRRLAREKGFEALAGVSLCLFLCMVAYAIGTFFFHIAYSSYLPTLTGLSAVNYAITHRMMRTSRQMSGAVASGL